MKLVTSEAMATIDADAQEEYAIPGLILMEHAGILLASDILERCSISSRVVVLCGKGNNGGDALVVARHLWISGHKDLFCLFMEEKGSDSFETQRRIIEKLQIPHSDFEEYVGKAESEAESTLTLLFEKASIIIDGLLGTGLSGAPRLPYSIVIDILNASSSPVYSIDVPSGISEPFRPDWSCVAADFTGTIGFLKTELYTPLGRKKCGKIRVLPISFPDDLTQKIDTKHSSEFVDPKILDPLPEMDPFSHKRSRGNIIVFAGSTGMTGAALLTANSALRARAGLVTLFCDENIYPILAASSSAVMVRPMAQKPRNWDELGEAVFVAGPGWGTGKDRESLLLEILESGGKVVLDADAIRVAKKLLSEKKIENLYGRCVLTPHIGEFSFLTGNSKSAVQADLRKIGVATASRLHADIIVKGHVSWLFGADGSVAVFDGMEPHLSTAGTGDVLAGICGGLISTGIDNFYAMKLAVSAHWKAAKNAVTQNGCITAEDLMKEVGKIFV